MTATTATNLIVVDSSGWLEFITDDVKADAFAPYIEPEDRVLVPAIVVYEVSKRLLKEYGDHGADLFLSFAFRRRIVGLDEYLALGSAEISLRRRLSMPDAIIYATAQNEQAQLITGDAAFQGLPGVTLI